MKKITLFLCMLPFLCLAQWTQIGQDINGEFPEDENGDMVCLNSAGNIIAIGANGNDGNGINSGYVRVFQNSSGQWNQIGQDINGEFPGDRSGRKISLSANGDRLAIGARYNDGNGIDSGHVRIYEYNGSNWEQLGADINGAIANEGFGRFVDLNDDGNVIAIGAHGDLHSVRVYAYDGSNWNQIGTDIIGSIPEFNFGVGLSLNSDGTILAVGDNLDDTNGTSAGMIKVYQYNGSQWNQIGGTIYGQSEQDNFGFSPSLSSDGTILAVGAIELSNGYEGYVKVFKYQMGNWIQLGSVLNGEASHDNFGYCTSINSDGSVLAVGGYQNGGAMNEFGTGHVRVFQYDGVDWNQVGEDIDGDEAVDEFGRSVSLNSDGSILAVGGPLNDENGFHSGHVKVFTNSLLSVQDNTFGSDFLIHPNPSYGLSKIQLGEKYNTVRISIVDIIGKVVDKREYANRNTIDINTQSYPEGVYIIQIQSEGKKATIKLVVE